MNKAEIIGRLQELAFDSREYWLITGAAMVLYGLKDETCDIDLGCSRGLADELENRGYQSVFSHGKRKFIIGDDVEIMEDFPQDRCVVKMGEFPLLSLESLLDLKEKMNREKDQADIVLLKRHLKHEG